MKKYLTIIALLSIISSTPILAQSVKTDFDKKVIMVDSLNLPPNSSVLGILRLLPELLQRPGDFLISNYDVQIGGMSVGKSIDAAIQQLQIVDIEKIEVSESPVSSYNNNGQGGSINIVLRSSSKNDSAVWGSAGITAAYPTDIAPQFYLGYKTPRILIRGLILGEIYNTTSEANTVNFEDNVFVDNSMSSNASRFRNHLARAYIEYKASAHDVLNIDISEMYSYQSSTLTRDYTTQDSKTHSNSSSMQAMVSYKHTFGKSKFSTNIQYVYSPGNNSYDGESYSNNNDYTSHQISGNLELTSTLLQRPAVKGLDEQKIDVSCGVNLNGVIKKEEISFVDRRFGDNYPSEIMPDNKTYYIMPYARLESTLGKLRVKLVGEFQHFRYDIMRGENMFSANSNDITGKFVTEWHFTQQRNLRFILDRKLQRPTDEQLYPYRMYNPLRMQYVEGFPELTPMISHEASLDYIANYSLGSGGTITFNAGGSFNHVSDIINSYYDGGNFSGGSGMIGLTQRYLTFANNGRSNILGANIMALYTHSTFTISVTGNIFHNHANNAGTTDHKTYYNISINPHFSMKAGWHGGARFIYYSRVDQINGSLGDCAVAKMTVGKAWKRCFVYLSQNLSIFKNNKDITIDDNKRTEKFYDMVNDVVGIGMKYTF